MPLTITIDTIKRANKRHAKATKRAYWFEPGAMKFFRTRIIVPEGTNGVYTNHQTRAAYFITSEAYDAWTLPRFTIRAALLDKHGFPTGTIDTVGDFQAFERLEDAKREITRLSLATPNH